MFTGVVLFTGPDGRALLATSSFDRTVNICDVSADTLFATLSGHTNGVTGIVSFVGADGRTLIATCSYDQTVRIWDPMTSAQLAVLGGHTDLVTGIVGLVGDDGRTLLATGSIDGTVRVWDPIREAEVLTVKIGAPVETIAATPPGVSPPIIAYGGDRGFGAFSLEIGLS